MKQGIHPQVFENAQVVCSCGKSFTTISTKQSINVEVCSNCHPYFTGEHRFIDTKGRVEEFNKKQELAKKLSLNVSNKKKRIKGSDENQPKTLKELLNEIWYNKKSPKLQAYSDWLNSKKKSPEIDWSVINWSTSEYGKYKEKRTSRIS